MLRAILQQRNMVAFDEESKPKLLPALTLEDALRDLPPVNKRKLDFS